MWKNVRFFAFEKNICYYIRVIFLILSMNTLQKIGYVSF